jgi:hypothetical protein
MEETLLGFTVLGGPLLLLGYWFWLRAAHRRDLLRLAERAMDKGQVLDQAFIESLGAPPQPSPDRDLRRGMIFVALALAVCVFGVVVNEEVFFGLSSFPGFVGLAYLAFWLRGRSDEGVAAEAGS